MNKSIQEQLNSIAKILGNEGKRTSPIPLKKKDSVTYTHMPFGKFKGVPIDDLVLCERPYLEYLVQHTSSLNPLFRKELIELLENNK